MCTVSAIANKKTSADLKRLRKSTPFLGPEDFCTEALQFLRALRNTCGGVRLQNINHQTKSSSLKLLFRCRRIKRPLLDLDLGWVFFWGGKLLVGFV